MSDNQLVITALNEPTPQDRIKFRIGFKNRAKTKAAMLAYVDARYVMDKLDESVGKENWSASYAIIGKVMFCTIEVKWPDGSITSKSDCGMETEVDAEKGQASDAFKRASVHYGIGRDLYSMENHWADLDAGGYVDRDWKPIGWGSQVRPDSGSGDSASPTTTRPASQPPTIEENAAKLVAMADKIAERLPDDVANVQNSPKTDETVKNDDNVQLSTDTPPENRFVLVKNLLNQAKSKNGAVLYLPDSFTGDARDFEQTKPFWVGAQFIGPESAKMMNGRVNVKMTRWIAEEKGYKIEPEEKDDDLPF